MHDLSNSCFGLHGLSFCSKTSSTIVTRSTRAKTARSRDTGTNEENTCVLTMATSSSVTTVESKNAAIKERAASDKDIHTQVDRLIKIHVDGDVDVQRRCWPRLVGCPGLFSFGNRRTAVSTTEGSLQGFSAAAVSSTSTARQGSKIVERLVGRNKSENTEYLRIEEATKSVQSRLAILQERLHSARQRALTAKRQSNNEEALREMKRVKAVEKQLATATAALEALERQEDMLAQSTLQRELAVALSTTNKEVKKKHKGLLGFAEKTIDQAVELKDDAEDIGAVFDGLVGSTDTGVDDDDLLKELDDLVAEGVGSSNGCTQPTRAVSCHQRTETNISTPTAAAAAAAAAETSFPSVPNTEVVSLNSTMHDVRTERKALLSTAAS